MAAVCMSQYDTQLSAVRVRTVGTINYACMESAPTSPVSWRGLWWRAQALLVYRNAAIQLPNRPYLSRPPPPPNNTPPSEQQLPPPQRTTTSPPPQNNNNPPHPAIGYIWKAEACKAHESTVVCHLCPTHLIASHGCSQSYFLGSFDSLMPLRSVILSPTVLQSCGH